MIIYLFIRRKYQNKNNKEQSAEQSKDAENNKIK